MQGYELQNFYALEILFLDDSGKYHYEDIYHYLIVEATESYYLLEIGPDSQFEDILAEGQITGKDDVLAYEISEDAYTDLAALFDKP